MQDVSPNRPPVGGWHSLRSAGALLLGWGAILPGCGDSARVVQGTGPVVREQEALRPLSEIEVKGHVDLTVSVLPRPKGALEVDSGPPTMVFLEGAEDLLDWVDVTVDGDVLEISIRDDVRLDPLPSIHVDMASLTSVAAFGSGDIQLLGVTPESSLGEGLAVSVAGSTNVVARGVTGRLDLSHAGSGDLDFREVFAQTVTYSGAGSGDAWVRVAKSLESSTAGSGDVHVFGDVSDEAIESSTVGTSKLHRVR